MIFSLFNKAVKIKNLLQFDLFNKQEDDLFTGQVNDEGKKLLPSDTNPNVRRWQNQEDTGITENKPEESYIGNIGNSESENKDHTYNANVARNLKHMDTPASEWKAVPVKNVVVTKNDKGKAVSMPEFDFEVCKDFAHAPSLYANSSNSSDSCCELCGTGIKKVYWLYNQNKKWTLAVGSECVTHFQEGESGEQLSRKKKIEIAQSIIDEGHDLLEEFYKTYYDKWSKHFRSNIAIGLYKKAKKLFFYNGGLKESELLNFFTRNREKAGIVIKELKSELYIEPMDIRLSQVKSITPTDRREIFKVVSNYDPYWYQHISEQELDKKYYNWEGLYFSDDPKTTKSIEEDMREVFLFGKAIRFSKNPKLTQFNLFDNQLDVFDENRPLAGQTKQFGENDTRKFDANKHRWIDADQEAQKTEPTKPTKKLKTFQEFLEDVIQARQKASEENPKLKKKNDEIIAHYINPEQNENKHGYSFEQIKRNYDDYLVNNIETEEEYKDLIQTMENHSKRGQRKLEPGYKLTRQQYYEMRGHPFDTLPKNGENGEINNERYKIMHKLDTDHFHEIQMAIREGIKVSDEVINSLPVGLRKNLLTPKEKPKALSIEERVNRAGELGRKAFHAGKKASELMKLLEGLQVGQGGNEIMEAWSDAWHKENSNAPIEKQPYEMKKNDWVSRFTDKYYSCLMTDAEKVKADSPEYHKANIEDFNEIHKKSVQQALSEGKAVPGEVLKDYPELKTAQEQKLKEEAGNKQPIQNHGHLISYLKHRNMDLLLTPTDVIAKDMDKNFKRNQLPVSSAFPKEKKKCIDKMLQRSIYLEAKTKEPYEMSLEAYATSQFIGEAIVESNFITDALWIPIDDYKAKHKKAVEQALKNGEDVHIRILDDYPDLKQQYKSFSIPTFGIANTETPALPTMLQIAIGNIVKGTKQIGKNVDDNYLVLQSEDIKQLDALEGMAKNKELLFRGARHIRTQRKGDNELLINLADIMNIDATQPIKKSEVEILREKELLRK